MPKNSTYFCAFFQRWWHGRPQVMVTKEILVLEWWWWSLASFPTVFLDRHKGKGNQSQNYSIAKTH